MRQLVKVRTAQYHGKVTPKEGTAKLWKALQWATMKRDMGTARIVDNNRVGTAEMRSRE